MLKESVALAIREKQLPPKDLTQVNVDTSVQEKNITFPTDSKLLYRAIQKPACPARSRDIPMRQSYVRVGNKTAVRAGRYTHARQHKRMKRCLRKLRTCVGRLIRDIHRNAEIMDHALETLLSRAERIRQQPPHNTNKLYSLHEPDERRAGRRRVQPPQAPAADCRCAVCRCADSPM